MLRLLIEIFSVFDSYSDYKARIFKISFVLGSTGGDTSFVGLADAC